MQRARGTRVDDLTVEGKPGYYRVMRFGLFSEWSEASKEVIVDLKGLEELVDDQKKLEKIFPGIHPKDVASITKQAGEYLT
jgi:hypothetical protein